MSKEKVTMIVNSGEYQRVSYALTIAKVAAAFEMEVHILFTYGGLKRLIKSNTDELGNISDTDIQQNIKKALEKGSLTKLSDDLVNLKKMGVKIYACISSMNILNISNENLIEDVHIIGLSEFLVLSIGSITYFI